MATVIGTNGANTLTGTLGDDVLSGLGGNDILNALAGNDTLDGGTGDDTMRGGLGDDRYIVDSTLDVVIENANEGNDTVVSSVSFTLPVNVENLLLTGSTNINGTGNTLGNLITGNSGNNILSGGTGNDTMTGGAGADRITGGAGNDLFVYLAASDSSPNTNWATPPIASATRTWDVITDFTQGSDRIDVSAFLGATDLAWANTTPSGSAAWFAKSGTSTFVYVDVGGIEPPELMIELQNTVSLVLTANDFIGVVGSSGVNTAPVITSPGAFSIAENNTTVATITATDAPGQSITYSLIAGIDSTRFAINATTGALSFLIAPNFEAPTDVGANNVYNFTVQASDGSLASTQAIAVTVTDVINEAMTGGSGADSIVGTAGNDIITGNGGADVLTGALGSDTFVYLAASDSSPNANWATPPIATDLRTWDVITDFTQGSDRIDVSAFLGAVDLAWANTTPSGNAVWFAKSGTSTFVYVDVGGVEPPELMIELQNTASLVLTANDFIGVVGSSGVNTAPVLTSPAAFSIAENNTTVATIIATDAPGQSITYSLIAGIDSARFAINATTGALSFLVAPNFEAPTDVGANNVYNFTVQASDGSLAAIQAIAVTVTDVINEATTGGSGADTIVGTAGNDIITGNGGADVLTGALGSDTFVYLAASDSSPNTNWATPPIATDLRTWDVITDFTQGSDRIDVSAFLGAVDLAWANTTPSGNAVWFAKSGTSTFVYVDVGGIEPPELMIELKNTGSLLLTATDFIGVVGSGGSINTAPVITSPATFNVAENTTAVATVTATDAQAQTITYSLIAGIDSASFTINPASGVLSFVAAPNFEVPTDIGANNVYNFTVQASDGSLSTTQAIAVTVTDVVNEAIIYGTAGNDTLIGTIGDDFFDISQGGNDMVKADFGNDTVFSGAAFTSADSIDGGADSGDNVDTDTLVLDGNYSAGVLLGATTLTNVESIILIAGNNYKLTTNDATVSNSTMMIDGSQLAATNTMNIDASAETQSTSSYTFIGGAGNDLLTGGAGSDFFDLSFGGNDTVVAGAGRDSIDAGAAFNAADRIDGGTGIDFLYLRGNYAGGVVFDAATLTNTEVIILQGGNSYNLTPSNATVAAGQSLTIDGSAIGASNTVVVNAVAETDATAKYTLIGGAGNDLLRGGAGNDVIVGNGGSDTLAGGLGNDTFSYSALSDGGGTGDVITDFSKSGINGTDVLNLHDLLLTFAGYSGSNAFTGGYLQFDISSGTSTVVRVDSSGGADSFTILTTLTTIPATLLLPTDTANFIL